MTTEDITPEYIVLVQVRHGPERVMRFYSFTRAERWIAANASYLKSHEVTHWSGPHLLSETEYAE